MTNILHVKRHLRCKILTATCRADNYRELVGIDFLDYTPLWRGAKSILPSFATGAWDEGKGDATPVEHLYNLLFVRMPTVLMGILYMRNLSMGHPLVMNYGDGFFEVPPLVVLCVFLVILR